MKKIVKWTFIGLLIRFAIMPFTMHGPDLVFINYFPMMFVEKGIWDPYGLISANFSHLPVTYYGPVLFFIMSAANFVFIKLFHAISLVGMLEISGTMLGKSFTTVDYIQAFSGLNLFRNLFLMKIPYLVFDFLIAGILLKLAASEKQSLGAYKLWMLNIVVLQSVYAGGGAYVITAFFIIASVYAAKEKRPYLSILLLSLGGATKLLPYILVLPACLLLGNNWKKRFSLILTAGVSTLLLYFPFYFSSGEAILGFFMLSGNVQYPQSARFILMGIFLILYILICKHITRASQDENQWTRLLYWFTIIIFLCYATFAVRFRYLVFISPLLVLIMPGHRKFGFFMLATVLMLAFQWLAGRNLQLGLFAPINPEYFLNLPAIHEIVGRFVNIEIIYKILARLLLLTFFIAAWWVWRIKSNNENIVFDHR